MAFLDRFPEALVGVFTSEWNGCNELCQLDSAYCTKQFRPFLLRICQHKTFTIPFPSCCDHLDMYNWLFAKLIKPKGMLAFYAGTFWADTPLSDKTLDGNVDFFSNVTGVSVSGYRAAGTEPFDDENRFIFKLARFINMCPKLDQLVTRFVHSFNYSDLFHFVDQPILRQMTSFSCTGIYKVVGIDMTAVNTLAMTCNRLVTVEMNVSNWDEREIFILLARHSTSLLTVSLAECHLTTAFLETLVVCLSQQRIRNLTLCALSHDGMAAKFAHDLLISCKSLVNLHVYQKVDSGLKGWLNSIKLININSENRKTTVFFSKLCRAEDMFRHQILAVCSKISCLILSYLSINGAVLLLKAVLRHHCRTLRVLSVTRCDFGAESFELLRKLFTVCVSLTVIKITRCTMSQLYHNTVTLLSFLPPHVTKLLIGGDYCIDLNDLLVIVRSNPHLEVLWYADCRVESEECDYEGTKAKVLECGGEKLRVIDDLWPEFSDEFYDSECFGYSN